MFLGRQRVLRGGYNQWNLAGKVPRGWLLIGAQTSVQSGDTINTTNVETAFSTTLSIAANTMRVGQCWWYQAIANFGTDGASPGNWRWKFKHGTKLLCQTGSSAVAAGISGRTWILDAFWTVISIGSSGTVEAQGFVNLMNNASATTGREMPNAAVVSVDTTAAIACTTTITMSVSDADNTSTLRQSRLLLFNP